MVKRRRNGWIEEKRIVLEILTGIIGRREHRAYLSCQGCRPLDEKPV